MMMKEGTVATGCASMKTRRKLSLTSKYLLDWQQVRMFLNGIILPQTESLHGILIEMQ